MVDGADNLADAATAPMTPNALRPVVRVPSSGRVDFARYELGELLGEGGYGSVFAAWDSRLQRSVALKRLNLQVGAGGDAEAWVQEARLAARVSHRAFVTVYDVFVDQGAGHIVMELVQGRSLSRVLAAGPLPVEQAVQWALQASEALAEAHQLNIAHGDIKPGNLMVDEGGQLRILDFGVARLIDRMATLGPGSTVNNPTGQPQVSGTLAYMAPEQMLGRPASVASDIYALGLVLGEMLSGQRAFMEPDPLALAHHKLHGSELILALPELPAGLAPLAALVQRMVSRQPALRPASMVEVSQALRALVAQCQGRALLPVQRAAARRWLSLPGSLQPARATRLRMLLATGLLLSLLGLAAWRWQGEALSQPPWPLRLAQAEQLYRNLEEEGVALDRIAAQLESVASEQPKNARTQALLALVYASKYSQESRDEAWLQRADASAQQALAFEDQLALSHIAQAQVLRLQGRVEASAAAFEQALQLDGQSDLALHGYAMLELARGRAGPARALLERGLSFHPDQALLLNGMGQLLYEQNALAEAEAVFRRVIAAVPHAVSGYANLSAVLVRSNRLEEAQTVLQQGLGLRPSSQLYTNLGNVLFGRARYAEAAVAFERALSAEKGRPNDYRMWANLADTLRVLPGRGEDAKRAYRHALEQLLPLLERHAQDSAQFSRAALYAARINDPGRARLWSHKALALAPQAPDVLFRTAVAAELSGDREQALIRLLQARTQGYPAHFIEQEADLAALRRDSRYHQWSPKEKQSS